MPLALLPYEERKMCIILYWSISFITITVTKIDQMIWCAIVILKNAEFVKNVNHDILCYTDVLGLFGYCDQNCYDFLYMLVSKFFSQKYFCTGTQTTFQSPVDAAPHRMRNMVYKRSSVCLSVYPINRQQQRRAAGLLLSTVRAGDIDGQWRAPTPSSNDASARRWAAKRRQCHVDSRGTRLNTDLLVYSHC